jgi:uncharacterized protein YybS (DUF2232 family)
VIVLVYVLAVIGLLTLIFLAWAFLDDLSSSPPVDDLAAPYREGLHAAEHLQKIAADMEQRVQQAAAMQPDKPPEKP